MRKFAISDIHGCAKTFKALVQDKIKLKIEDELYLLGDYVDRGPDSKGVIDFILKLTSAGYQIHCLLGNHEDMMLKALISEKDLELWMYNGGKATLESFEVEKIEEIPAEYIKFIKNLAYYKEVDEYILVHAGLNFKQENPLSMGSDMLWIRYWAEDIDHKWLGERIIVHGHTPRTKMQVLENYKLLAKQQYLNIDCGCCYKKKAGKGKLCALELIGQRVYFQENIEAELN